MRKEPIQPTMGQSMLVCNVPLGSYTDEARINWCAKLCVLPATFAKCDVVYKNAIPVLPGSYQVQTWHEQMSVNVCSPGTLHELTTAQESLFALFAAGSFHERDSGSRHLQRQCEIGSAQIAPSARSFCTIYVWHGLIMPPRSWSYQLVVACSVGSISESRLVFPPVILSNVVPARIKTWLLNLRCLECASWYHRPICEW